MYLAWVECIAPIVEAKRQLPKGQICVRVLCSDRDSNMTTIHGKHRTEFDQELARKQSTDTSLMSVTATQLVLSNRRFIRLPDRSTR